MPTLKPGSLAKKKNELANFSMLLLLNIVLFDEKIMLIQVFNSKKEHL
jgi:hypothetical protein